MITQPLVAVAYCPEGTTVAEYSRHVAGTTAIKNSTGNWTFLLDTPVPSGNLIVLATPVLATALRAYCVVTLGGANASGFVQQFEVSTFDNGGTALDTGIMVGVSEIPVLD